MQYAINVADLMIDLITKDFMVLPVCPNKRTIIAEKDRLDGIAIILECDENRALSIIQVIRSKYHKNKFRCYESKTGVTWKRI